MTTRLDFPAYLDHLAADSARFRDVLRDVPGDRPVPTCPDWTADDLLFHLAEVQWYWARIVGRRIVETAEAEGREVTRPSDRHGLDVFFAAATQSLQETLRLTPPDTPVWSWAPDHTAGFSYRRQAHEALIHRVDAEETAGNRTAIDPALAADGIDEALGVMYGGPPGWGTFTPDLDRVVRFASSDTGHAWTVSVGQFAGTDPDDGRHHTFACLDAVGADSPVSAKITGTAADLDCWLWRRPSIGEVITTGSTETLAALVDSMEDGIQ